MKNMKSHIATLFLLLILPAGIIKGQDLPVPKAPSDWVNDYAGIFSSNERKSLSQKLNLYQYNNSTQIFIVTINENNGYPASMLGPMIGEEWGIGQKGKDNGLLLLMDMKDRDVFITTGYGLEEYIPDAIAKRIVENEIIPAFKQGNYYGGVNAATDVMIDLLEGKFTPDEYRQQSSGSSDAGSAIGGIIFMIFLFSAIFGSRRRSYGTGGRRSNLPLWIALGMMSGSHGRGSYGNFSSGSGGFGGFGGFTGGGGGSFGGGGAGGSW